MNSDECTKEVQRVLGSISMAEFKPRVLRESRQTEIDFVDGVLTSSVRRLI